MTANTTRWWLALLTSFIFLIGCGEDSASDQQAQNPTTPTTPETPEMPNNAGEGYNEEEMPGGEYAGGEYAAVSSEMSQPKTPPRPPRPENPADWSSQHITSAIEERDVKVQEALTSYIDSRQGDDHAAQEIVAWLLILNDPPVDATAAKRKQNEYGSEYPPPTAPGGEAPPEYTEEMYNTPGYTESGEYGTSPSRGKNLQADQQIAESLIDALIGIQSLTSYQAARDLIGGQLGLSIDQEQIARFVMSGLFRNIRGSHDPATKILKQTLLQPDLVCKSQGDFDARRLQNASMEEHWKHAMSLMDGLAGVDTTELHSTNRRPGNEYGGSYDASYAPPSTTESPEMEADNNDRSPEQKLIPDDLQFSQYTQEQAQASKEYFWAPELIDEVTQRLTVSDTLMREPDLIMLAGQIPATSSRHALKQFFEKNWIVADDWTRNPIELVKQDAFKKYFRDPGLLLSVKALPREQIRQGSGPGEGAGGGEYGNAPNNPRRGQDDDPRERASRGQWFQASEHLLLGLMDRMHRAASQGTLPQSSLEELDVDLHRKATVTLDARLELMVDKMSAHTEEPMPDRTTVNYVRIELSNLTPALGQSIVKHYHSELRGENVYSILNNNGMWLESTGHDRGSNELVSQDVLLSRNNARPPIKTRDNNDFGNEFGNENEGFAPPSGEYGNSGGQGGFVVEILTVRIPDPEEFLKPPEEATVSQN